MIFYKLKKIYKSTQITLLFMLLLLFWKNKKIRYKIGILIIKLLERDSMRFLLKEYKNVIILFKQLKTYHNIQMFANDLTIILKNAKI